MGRSNSIGVWGENVACEYLTGLGYAICDRNWRSGHYEIDIIAMKNDRIVFVEVKTRSDEFMDAAKAVDRPKIRRLVRAADTYIKTYDIPHEYQFDLITVVGGPSQYKIDHIPDAFIPAINNLM